MVNGTSLHLNAQTFIVYLGAIFVMANGIVLVAMMNLIIINVKIEHVLTCLSVRCHQHVYT